MAKFGAIAQRFAPLGVLQNVSPSPFLPQRLKSALRLLCRPFPGEKQLLIVKMEGNRAQGGNRVRNAGLKRSN